MFYCIHVYYIVRENVKLVAEEDFLNTDTRTAQAIATLSVFAVSLLSEHLGHASAGFVQRLVRFVLNIACLTYHREDEEHEYEECEEESCDSGGDDEEDHESDEYPVQSSVSPEAGIFVREDSISLD